MKKISRRSFMAAAAVSVAALALTACGGALLLLLWQALPLPPRLLLLPLLLS